MKKFFLSVLSSFTGTWLAICLFGIVAAIVAFAILVNIGINSSNNSKQITFSDNGLLILDLSGEIVERGSNQNPDFITIANGDFTKPKSLSDIVAGIKSATENDKIKAMYIDCGNVSVQPAMSNAIRNAINTFKSSGKPVYAYAESMTQSAYYIASVADSIFVNPYGNLIMSGIGGYTPYFKGLLDKFGIEFEVVKVGTYKSAVEPYILTEMSQPAKAQLDTLYNSLWDKIKHDISLSRNINPEQIDYFINNDYISSRDMKYVMSTKLIDGLCYRHQMNNRLATLMNVDKFEDIEFVKPEDLLDTMNWNTTNPHIAVVYAYGGIDDGSSSGIISEDLVPLILSLKDNENVEGLILRVNSPGGSAYGSEQIWESLEQFKSTGKPFIVSMGDYAASGGYYISSGADRIFANPLTITGSIGIFGLIPNADKLIQDKLGINFQLVATNPEGAYPSLVKPLTAGQYASLQKSVEDGYDTFTSRVAQGRKMSQDEVKRIGEGRVWSASQALQIGLVDELGTLDDAIDYMSEKLSMGKNPNIVLYPESGNTFWTYLSMLEDENLTELARNLGFKNSEELLLHQIKILIERPHIQARMAEMIIKF